MGMNKNVKLGILGCGNMGGAILRAIVSKNVFRPEDIIIYDKVESITEKFSDELGVNKSHNEADLFVNSDIVIFAVKPQALGIVLDSIVTRISIEDYNNVLIVSIAAGIPIKFYEKRFPHNPIVRVMPNINALVGEAASAISINNKVTDSHISTVEKIFGAIGLTVRIDEKYMDVVTGLSGSGPAFVSMFIEAMADAAVLMGLPRNVSYKLAEQTVKGTAEMLLRRSLHPAELKDRVTSPGGTTIAGLRMLEKEGFRYAIIEAIRAATERSEELGKNR